MAEKKDPLLGLLKKKSAEMAKIDAELGPLRDKRDALVRQNTPVEKKIRDMGKRIKELQEEKAPIEREVQAYTAALGGGKAVNDLLKEKK